MMTEKQIQIQQNKLQGSKQAASLFEVNITQCGTEVTEGVTPFSHNKHLSRDDRNREACREVWVSDGMSIHRSM